MTTDTPTRTLATERHARVYDPMVTQCQGDLTDTTSGENLLIARPPNEHTREPHSQPRTPLRRIWLITLSNTNPIELQGIVGNKTLHTLATYRRLCIYHTPPNNVGISLSSVIVIIQGDVSVSVSTLGFKLESALLASRDAMGERGTCM